MTIGEMIAQLRSIQDSFGDLPVWLDAGGEFYAPAWQALYCKENQQLSLPERVEVSATVGTTLQVDVSDSAAVGDQLG